MYSKIYEMVTATKAISTHSHHKADDFFRDFNLDKLLRESYIAWCGEDFDDSKESKRIYLERVRYKSYFVSLQTAVKKLYNIDEVITAENWQHISDAIVQKYKDTSWHKTILKKYCNYEKSILDAYWDPGSDNNNPQLFTTTFRTDCLFFAFDTETVDHDGWNAYKLYGHKCASIDEHIDFVRKLIKEKVANGSICLKKRIGI